MTLAEFVKANIESGSHTWWQHHKLSVRGACMAPEVEWERTYLDLPRVVFLFFLILKIKGHSHPLLSLLLPQSWIKAVAVRLIIWTHAHTRAWVKMPLSMPLVRHIDIYARVHTLIMPRLLRKHVVGQNLLFGFRVGFCLQRDQSLRLQKQTEMEGGINAEQFFQGNCGSVTHWREQIPDCQRATELPGPSA